ncbi:MAG: hypothetical protein U9O85_05205 [Euryarchaeota archaeon]|nr:hypothetical protein [Euryarchaeota archaeon]
MKKGKATLISLLVVFTLVASMSAVSAADLCGHTVEFVSHTYDGTYSTWTYNVTSGSAPAISHWIIFWCNKSAFFAASEEAEYVYSDPQTGKRGIKFEKGYEDNETRTVWFKLLGNPPESQVEVTTKAGNDQVCNGYVTGPIVECNGNEIPEFTTVAIPVCMIFGLFYFFRRKRQNE